MHFFDTGDRVVDACLRKLEGYGTWTENSNAESTHQLLSGMIHVQEMLPKAVATHFQFPTLFVGNAHFSGNQDYRTKLINSIKSAVNLGLERVKQDLTLRRENNPDFCDRPRSRGEEILDALGAFQKDRSTSAFSKLTMAASNTNRKRSLAPTFCLSV